MHWQKENIESFFGARFTFIDPVHEMYFEGGGIRYRLWLDVQQQLVVLTGDVSNPDGGFPAIEICFHCECINETVAIGIGPVLLFHSRPEPIREHVRLCITRTDDRHFSLSPNLS